MFDVVKLSMYVMFYTRVRKCFKLFKKYVLKCLKCLMYFDLVLFFVCETSVSRKGVWKMFEKL